MGRVDDPLLLPRGPGVRARGAQCDVVRVGKLEQLRALENGMSIGVVVRDGAPPMEVDTDDDLAKVREVVAALEDGDG